MARIRLWHGSREEIREIDLGRTIDHGFHCGDEVQARMRTGPNGILHEVEADIGATRRCRDTGGNWHDRIADARRRGYDAIVYLNRYEGIPAERIDRLAADGNLGKLDDLGDAAFRRLVPEARDSHIILHASDVRVLRIIRPKEPVDTEDGVAAPGL